jgi:hypothetical protein
MIFTGADLSNASLRYSYFRKADLSSTDLQGANLSDSFFDEVRFDSTNLADANLTRATFINSDLSRVRGLNKAVLEGTVIDLETDFPPDFDVCRPLRQGSLSLSLRMPNQGANTGKSEAFMSAKTQAFVARYGCNPFTR